jgi:hypothetical protein
VKVKTGRVARVGISRKEFVEYAVARAMAQGVYPAIVPDPSKVKARVERPLGGRNANIDIDDWIVVEWSVEDL